MKPTERRLLRHIPSLRAYLAITAGAGVAVAGAVIAQASLLAWILAEGFLTHAPPAQLTGAIAALLAVVAVRAGLAWGQGTVAQRTVTAVKSELRGRLLAHTQDAGPVALARWRRGEVATLVTRGLDGLDPYFTGYLPKLVTATILPLAVIVRIGIADWSSAVVICVTLPLIPVFAVLVGWHTRDRTARQWGLLSRLGGHFLDVVAGLPTLRAFGRARAQAGVVRGMADAHRTATIRTLRVAFLSSLVLELVATLSVALVAVPIGLRLMDGGVGLRTALLILFLAPEAYLPLRAAGAAFHDSMEGVAVAERAFAMLDEEGDGIGGRDPEQEADAREAVALPTPTGAQPLPSRAGAERGHPASPTDPAPSPYAGGVSIERVTARYPGQEAAALSGASLRVRPGERVALVGPSGAGKSTVLALLLRFLTPESGRLLAGDVDITGLDADAWRLRIAWVPQRPHLFAGSVADNIRLGHPDAPPADVREAARAAAAEEFIAELPRGYDTVLGERGAGLSAGQRQRIALARAFLRDAPLLLLDEPTAHLDPYSEAAVVDASGRLMAGRTALIVAHRYALVSQADRVVRVRSGHVDTLDWPLNRAPDQPGARARPAAATNLTLTR